MNMKRRFLSSASQKIEAIVIGAGVIGLASARALAMAGKEVLIIERDSHVGSGTSSRNSEVIHAGIYYPPNSLKASLCVAGKQLLYQYCKERSIPYSKVGKLIVASESSQVSSLNNLHSQAQKNGVKDLQFLNGDEVANEFEPEVQCHAALFSPSTGILDSHSLLLHLLADVEESGGILALNSKVSNVGVSSENKIIVSVDDLDLSCDILVNCAGLSAHTLTPHTMAMNNESTAPNKISRQSFPRQYFAKGNYFRLVGQPSPFKHLVYPIPQEGGLGVHATIDLNRNTRFGPDVEWLDPDSETCLLDYNVDEQRAESFYGEIRRYWPGLKDGALQPDYSGIRPKLGHVDVKRSGLVNSDFYIKGKHQHGIKGLVHMLGMESPGLTSSLAIADHAIKILTEDGCL